MSTGESLAVLAFGAAALWGLNEIGKAFQRQDERIWTLEAQLEAELWKPVEPAPQPVPVKPLFDWAEILAEFNSSAQSPPAVAVEAEPVEELHQTIANQQARIDALERQVGPGRTIRRN